MAKPTSNRSGLEQGMRQVGPYVSHPSRSWVQVLTGGKEKRKTKKKKKRKQKNHQLSCKKEKKTKKE